MHIYNYMSPKGTMYIYIYIFIHYIFKGFSLKSFVCAEKSERAAI